MLVTPYFPLLIWMLKNTITTTEALTAASPRVHNQSDHPSCLTTLVSGAPLPCPQQQATALNLSQTFLQVGATAMGKIQKGRKRQPHDEVRGDHVYRRWCIILCQVSTQQNLVDQGTENQIKHSKGTNRRIGKKLKHLSLVHSQGKVTTSCQSKINHVPCRA